MLIDATKNSRNKRFIIETHSEHFIIRIQRRIAEEIIDPEDVNICYCEMTPAGTQLTSLDLNNYGQFYDWPKGFFQEDFKYHLAILEAAVRRNAKE